MNIKKLMENKSNLLKVKSLKKVWVDVNEKIGFLIIDKGRNELKSEWIEIDLKDVKYLDKKFGGERFFKKIYLIVKNRSKLKFIELRGINRRNGNLPFLVYMEKYGEVIEKNGEKKYKIKYEESGYFEIGGLKYFLKGEKDFVEDEKDKKLEKEEKLIEKEKVENEIYEKEVEEKIEDRDEVEIDKKEIRYEYVESRVKGNCYYVDLINYWHFENAWYSIYYVFHKLRTGNGIKSIVHYVGANAPPEWFTCNTLKRLCMRCVKDEGLMAGFMFSSFFCCLPEQSVLCF